MTDVKRYAPPKARATLEELADRYDSDEEFWTRAAEILVTVHDMADDGHVVWESRNDHESVFEIDFKVPTAPDGRAWSGSDAQGEAYPDPSPRPYDLALRPPPPNVGSRAALIVGGLMGLLGVLSAILTG